MPIRKPNPDTHQNCRSLLQKAVRRGCIPLIKKTVDHLVAVGDIGWLTRRVEVIVFEECWPLGVLLDKKLESDAIIDILSSVAISKKEKDAAGLGALAYELSRGDTTVLNNSPTDDFIQMIADAIKKPAEFWKLIEQKSSNEHGTLIANARNAFKHGGWPWDRAFMQAAALLAVFQEIPDVEKAIFEPCNEFDFPYWVAIDKHTTEGKEIIKTVAQQTGKSGRIVSWLFFYYASAIENEANTSYWWNRENQWRLSKLGLSLAEGEKIWQTIFPTILANERDNASKLKNHILSTNGSSTIFNQLSFFERGNEIDHW